MIILLIFAIIFFLLQLFFTLKIKIEITNLNFNFPKSRDKYTNNNSQILLKVYVLKKIKVAQFDLKKINLNNEKFKSKIQKNIQEEKININTINFLKNSNYILEKMDLKIKLGTKDAAITAISIGIISTIIGNFLGNKINDIKNQRFEVIPIYQNRNFLKVEFGSIFTFNMANIIGIVKYFKRRVDKNGRTSYRRSYAYSNE